MVQLNLSFLGTFQVTLGNEPITRFRSANVQGLLVYLAIQPGRAFSRDVLATLFWPEEPDSVARTNFRQTLYQLRKLLAKGEDEERPFLAVSRQTVQFNAESDHRCDVTLFLQALKAGDLATAVDHPDGLYHDDLLPGFTCDSLAFEDWLRREQERLHGLALDALQQRTDWLLSSGNYAEAKAMAQRQLALEPWRELAHRQLMQAQALAGDRQAAMAQFEACREVLWAELASEPESETVTLAEQLAAGEDVQLRPRPRHNLNAPVTAYFGREADLAAVRGHITDRAYRLVTLVGEGGIGKSRLALEVAWQLRDQFTDGVWFVPLAGLEAKPLGGSASDEVARNNLLEVIATAVSQAMDHSLAGQHPPREQLLTYLRERQLLLVLDNYDHLLDGAELILELLQKSPGVCIICTSREPLNFQAEWVLPLERLPLPPIADPFLNTTAVSQDPATFPAVQLFVDRAQRANGRFELTEANQAEIVALCRLLAGLPLALELAAAALRHQTMPELIAAIQQSIDTLATQRRDIPPRHRSMRAVFDSSWALLSAAEQAQLAALAVFLGPFSVRAATAVTNISFNQLQALQEKSLLQGRGDRFGFHALLRQFAAEKLTDFSQDEAIARRHSHYYLQAVADLGMALNGEMPHLAVQRIAGALENVRGAWETAVARSDWEPLLAALVPLSDFYQIRGLYREGLRLFGEAADRLRDMGQPDALAQLLAQQAAMHVRLSNYPSAIQKIEEALPLTTGAWVIARLHITLGEALWRQGELADAEINLREALAIALENELQQLRGVATYHLGVLYDLKGELEQSLSYLEGALGIWQLLNNRRWQGNTLTSLGFVAQEMGQWTKAEQALAKALALSRSIQDRRGEINSLGNLSNVFTQHGDYSKASKHLLAALKLAEMTGDQHVQASLYFNLAWNAQKAGKLQEADNAANNAYHLFALVGDRRGEGRVSKILGELAIEKGNLSEARERFRLAFTLFEQIGDQVNVDEMDHALKNLAVRQKQRRE